MSVSVTNMPAISGRIRVSSISLKPQWITAGAIEVKELTDLTIVLATTTAPEETQYELISGTAPVWLNLEFPKISGKAEEVDALGKTYSFVIRATHTRSQLFTDQTFSLQVTNVNQPPLWSSPSDLGLFASSSSVRIQLSAVDPDRDPLLYRISTGNLPQGLTLSSSGLLSGQITGTHIGVETFAFDVTVSDGQGGSATRGFTMRVSDSLVWLDATGDITVHETESLDVTRYARQGNTSVRYYLTGSPPSGISYTAGVFSGVAPLVPAAGSQVDLTNRAENDFGSITRSVRFTVTGSAVGTQWGFPLSQTQLHDSYLLLTDTPQQLDATAYPELAAVLGANNQKVTVPARSDATRRWAIKIRKNPEPKDFFASTLYTGNGASQAIATGVDTRNNGLLWIATRSKNYAHALFDPTRGGNSSLNPSSTSGAYGTTAYDQTFAPNGFTLNSSLPDVNERNTQYVALTFKRLPRFFETVKYLGDGTGNRSISHTLGIKPGMIIVKAYSAVGGAWAVYHRSMGASYSLALNSQNVQAQTPDMWNSTEPTSTGFTVGSNAAVNATGTYYVAYVFAHDTSANGMVQCGSGSGDRFVANLGWTPRFVLTRPYDGAGNWLMFDTTRGITSPGADALLRPNMAVGESVTTDYLDLTDTGFVNRGIGSLYTNSLYLAIR